MSQHEQVVAWARLNIGQHEVPAHSNTGTFVRFCQSATWLGGTRWPWCVAFAVRAWTVAGRTLPYRGAGAYTFLAWHKTHAPAWVVAASKAKPGAMVVFNIGSGHMGILVEPFSKTDPMIHTVDGNVSDKVDPRSRHISVVRGVIDPPEKPTGTIPPAKKPVFEVVGSESGHAKIVYVSGSKAISRKLGQLLNRYGGLTIRRRKPK